MAYSDIHSLATDRFSSLIRIVMHITVCAVYILVCMCACMCMYVCNYSFLLMQYGVEPYAFIEYTDHGAADFAVMIMNNRVLFEKVF